MKPYPPPSVHPKIVSEHGDGYPVYLDVVSHNTEDTPLCTPEQFTEALEGIRAGKDYWISGRRLIVDGVELRISDEQFDIAYDTMDELDDPNDWEIGLPRDLRSSA